MALDTSERILAAVSQHDKIKFLRKDRTIKPWDQTPNVPQRKNALF
jgi:hypothetical protein